MYKPNSIKDNMHYYTISLLGARPKTEDEIQIMINMDGSNQNQKEINYFGIFDCYGGE